MKSTRKRKEIKNKVRKWDEDICEKELESKPRLPIYRKFKKQIREEKIMTTGQNQDYSKLKLIF